MDGAQNKTWSVVLIVPKGTLLLVQARGFVARDRNFPGGDGALDEQTAQHTAARVLQEETGLIATLDDFSILDTWTGERGQPVYAYLVTRYKGRPSSRNKGKVFWTKNYGSLMARTSTFASFNTRIIRKLLEIRPAA